MDHHAREIGNTAPTRAVGPTALPSTAAPLPFVNETDASHKHLFLLLSKIDPLPQLQTIQWIPRGLDRRYAAVRLQALDRAMQAAEASTAAPTRRLWKKMTLLIPHLILRRHLATSNKKGWAASGTKSERGWPWLRGNLEQLPNGAIEDQEKENNRKDGAKVLWTLKMKTRDS